MIIYHYLIAIVPINVMELILFSKILLFKENAFYFKKKC